MLGGWVNPHREQQTIPQGQTSIPPKYFSTPMANGQSAPRSGSARGVGRGAGSHTPRTASEGSHTPRTALDKVCGWVRASKYLHRIVFYVTSNRLFFQLLVLNLRRYESCSASASRVFFYTFILIGLTCTAYSRHRTAAYAHSFCTYLLLIVFTHIESFFLISFFLRRCEFCWASASRVFLIHTHTHTHTHTPARAV